MEGNKIEEEHVFILLIYEVNQLKNLVQPLAQRGLTELSVALRTLSLATRDY